MLLLLFGRFLCLATLKWSKITFKDWIKESLSFYLPQPPGNLLTCPASPPVISSRVTQLWSVRSLRSLLRPRNIFLFTSGRFAPSWWWLASLRLPAMDLMCATSSLFVRPILRIDVRSVRKLTSLLVPLPRNKLVPFDVLVPRTSHFTTVCSSNIVRWFVPHHLTIFPNPRNSTRVRSSLSYYYSSLSPSYLCFRSS